MSAPRRSRLNGRVLLVAVGLLLLSALPASGADDLAEVRAATARFHRVAVAVEAGWNVALSDCFDNPGVGGMGYHYINGTEFDDALIDPLKPEALVYAPGPRGQLRLAAVEWIVPDRHWHAEEPPTVLGHDMHFNDGLELWVLHAWVFEHNPDGMFEDWNPRVTCP